MFIIPKVVTIFQFSPLSQFLHLLGSTTTGYVLLNFSVIKLGLCMLITKSLDIIKVVLDP